MTVRLVALLFVTGVVVVGGCQTTPTASVVDDGFVLRGKFSAANAETRFSARFFWQQSGKDFDLQFWGPLGQGRTRLVGDAQAAVLYVGGNEVSRGPASDITSHYLGFVLPIEVLPHWIFGNPHPGFSAQRTDSDHFRQLNWQIDVLDRAEVAGQPNALPSRLDASTQNARLRLSVNDWQLANNYVP